jgi:hypothetical protein
MDQWIAWACNFFLDRPIQYLLWEILFLTLEGAVAVRSGYIAPKVLGPHIPTMEIMYHHGDLPVTPNGSPSKIPCHWGLGHCSSEGALMWVWCSFWCFFDGFVQQETAGYHDYLMIILWLSWLSWGSFKCKKNQRHLLNLLIPPYSNEKWNIVKMSKSSHQEGFAFGSFLGWLCFPSLRQEAPEGPKSGERPIPTPSEDRRTDRFCPSRPSSG